MSDADLRGKRVLIREDLNVPVQSGAVTSDARIRAALPRSVTPLISTPRSSFSRTSGGRPRASMRSSFSLAPVAARLSDLLGQPVALRKDWLAGVDCPQGSAVLCENVRFNPGEKKDSELLARQMASLCDIFVMDCVRHGTSRRGEYPRRSRDLPRSPAQVRSSSANSSRSSGRCRSPRGRSLRSSQAQRCQLNSQCSRRFSKRWTAHRRRRTCQYFLAATGVKIGPLASRGGDAHVARALLAKARARGADIPLPTDVVVARDFAATAHADVRTIHEVRDNEMILDIGPDTARALQ